MKQGITYIAERIKERVPLAEAVEIYTGEQLIKNKMRCPFHGERTASFTVYPKTERYYCFGCGAAGDVISFAERYFNIDFNEAVKRLDGDFALGLLKTPTLSEHRRRVREAAQLKRKRQREQERSERINAEYWRAFDTVWNYEMIIEKQRPNSPEDEPDPEFIKALQNIEYARHQLDCAELERRKLSD